MCRAAEITRAQAKELHRDAAAVHAVKREEQHTKQPTKQRQQRMKTPKVSAADVEGHTYHDLVLLMEKSVTAVGRIIILRSVAKLILQRKKYIQLKSSQRNSLLILFKQT